MGKFSVGKQEEVKKIISSLNHDKGMTFDEIARAIGVTGEVISRWNTGVSNPRNKNFQRLKQLISEDPKLIAKREGEGESMSMLQIGMMIGEMKKSFEIEMGKMRREMSEIKKVVGLKEDEDQKQS